MHDKSPATGGLFLVSRYRLLVISLIVVVLAGGSLGCTVSVGKMIAREPTETATPIRTRRPTFTATVYRTDTPTPTITPTGTPIPSPTPIPSGTSTPKPTATPKPKPQAQPKPQEQPPTDTPAPTAVPATPTPAFEFLYSSSETMPGIGGPCAENNFVGVEIRISNAADDEAAVGYVVQAKNKTSGQTVDSQPSAEMGYSAYGQSWNHRYNLKVDLPGGYDGSTWEMYVIDGTGKKISESWDYQLDASCHNPAFVHWRRAS